MGKVYLSKLTQKFRIILEETFFHESPENRGSDHRRFFEIIPAKGFKAGPGQSGSFIGLYCEDPPILQLYSSRAQNAKTIWEEIKKYPGVWADFHIDGEALIFFGPEFLETVGRMAGARRRRTLSEAQKERLRLGREKAGLTRDEKGRLVHVQAQNSTQIEAIPAQAR